MLNFSRSCKLARVVDSGAIGGGINGASIDTRGFAAVTFVAAFGALSAGATLKAQQSSDDGSTDAFSDLEGSSVAVTATDDDKLAILDVVLPQQRYVRPVIAGEAGDDVDSVIAVLYGAKHEPVSHDASVAASEIHFSPDEGTA